jgi:hypothetical protein
MLLWPLGLVLIGCDGKDRGPACLPGDDPTLTIGLGLGEYTPIPDGGEFPLVHGPQGGYHLEIGLLATHLDASDLVVGHLEGTLDGEPFAAADPWLDFRCDNVHGGLAAYGSRLIYEATPEFLDGKVTEVYAEVTDQRGATVSTTATFTIRDDP